MKSALDAPVVRPPAYRPGQLGARLKIACPDRAELVGELVTNGRPGAAGSGTDEVLDVAIALSRVGQEREAEAVAVDLEVSSLDRELEAGRRRREVALPSHEHAAVGVVWILASRRLEREEALKACVPLTRSRKLERAPLFGWSVASRVTLRSRAIRRSGRSASRTGFERQSSVSIASTSSSWSM